MGEPRLGVYVCHCGGNISDYVDVKKVVEAVSDEANVVVAKDVMFACSDASQNEMIEDVKIHKLDRLVVASCSPKLHELTFRDVTERAGLNPYKFYHANIREQSSWAHTDDPGGATEKAAKHVRAAIAYVRLTEPLERIKTEFTPKVLIIGGGVAGIGAALDLSRIGTGVFLVEKSPFLGGRVAQLAEVYPYGRKGVEIARGLMEELKQRDNVVAFTNAVVESVSGYVGNFEVKIKVHPRYVKARCKKFEDAVKACPVEIPDEFNYGLTKRKAIYHPYSDTYPELPVIDMENCTKCGECVKVCGDSIDLEQKAESVKVKVGSITVTTGFDPYEPTKGEYGYGEFEGVVTLPQLVRLKELSEDRGLTCNGRRIEDIAFIYCVGSRQKKTGEEPVNEYCSRYCCNAAIYTSLSLLEKFKDLRIYHLYRDVRTYGRNELLYEDACKKGIVFIKFDEDDPPLVSGRDGKCLVSVKDLLIEGEALEILADMVVLVTGMVPRKNERLNEILKPPIGRDGFYLEIHPKLRPVETNISGLLIGGAAQSPKDIKETLSSAFATAAKNAALVLREELELDPFVAYIEPDRCSLSQLCIEECPYGAIEVREYEGKGKKAWVNNVKCKGCGACVAVCPTEAIQLKGFTNEQVRVMIEALGR